ncbi:PIN-like domain-containing protein [Marinilactibacillus sp. GCM10026970]|uniref:PIN-like domain-containing protein n=1 Tax=Marinilactibacillus sp. GCM10026970 TaxID=3252642 RepID=UPI00361F006C
MINTEDFNSFMEDMNPIIVLDSSSLLDLYRYSPDTSKSLLKIYRKEIENIWLPKQVSDEFLKNYEIIYQAQFNQFKKIATGVEQSANSLERKLNKSLLNAKKFFYPQVNDLENRVREELTRLKDISTEYEESIESQIQASYEYFQENNAKILIDELRSDGKIGPGFTKFEKISIFAEGDVRFRLEFPPGYRDIEKDKEDVSKVNKFGDLVLWKEILKKAKENQSSVLFITSDVKDDWWTLNNQGKILSMHPLLVEEFVNETELSDDNFLMLSTGDFFNLMIHRIQTHNITEKIGVLKDVYTLNAELKANELLDQHNKIESIEEELGLTASFIHDGEFQNYVPDVINDVEVLDISKFEIIDSVLYTNSDHFIIESIAEALCDIKAEVRVYDDMNVTFAYDVKISFNIQITIPIKSVNDVIEEEQPILRDIEEEELLEIENINFDFFDLSIVDCVETSSPHNDEKIYYNEICSECNKNHANYFKNNGERICESCSSNWDLCPDCGLFYPRGSLFGAFCESCEKEHD